jgi:hypothetical protein
MTPEFYSIKTASSCFYDTEKRGSSNLKMNIDMPENSRRNQYRITSPLMRAKKSRNLTACFSFLRLLCTGAIIAWLSGCASLDAMFNPVEELNPDQAKKTVELYSEAFNKEDLDGLMATFHRDSQDYLRAKSTLLKLFRSATISGQINQVSSIGKDENYVYLRLEQSFTATIPSPLPRGKAKELKAKQDMVFALSKDKNNDFRIWRVLFLEEPKLGDTP